MSSMRERLAAPFARPQGMLGRLAARLMLATNGPLGDWAMELLALQPAERVLEVGFGPGELVRRMIQRVPHLFVAGVDLSELMVAQAGARNAAAIARGQAVLGLGSAHELPYPDGSFDKAVTVNSIQFWPDITAGLRDVGRVLCPGGRLVIVLLDHRAPDVAAIDVVRARLVEAATTAGFTMVSADTRPARPRPAVAVVATWPRAI
jgi:ubiquinone/menaquinone biosynthesis C-methylase UbiE